MKINFALPLLLLLVATAKILIVRLFIVSFFGEVFQACDFNCKLQIPKLRVKVLQYNTGRLLTI